MAISLVLRKESGDDVRRAYTPYIPADATLSGRYPLLCGIDGYSDTIFNSRQMRQLLVEVEMSLVNEELSSPERVSLESVAELCREGQLGAHRFLWFIGD